MFKKVLIAEDFDTINFALTHALNELEIQEVHHAKYCDDALLKFKKALLDKAPFDLLISDLSFKSDHREVQIDSGDKLIQTIRAIDPSIKVIVYSIEDKSFAIKSLFHEVHIDAFVHKGRNSIVQLKTALHSILQQEAQYISPELNHLIRDKSTQEIDNLDIQIISLLAQGISQDKMDVALQNLNVTPNSKSYIEKRIGKLKMYLKANNATHLVAIAKDLGIV
jgi:DNA-binding NarL/FixJ family response regulator